MPEWDGLLPPVSCSDRPIIDGVRTPVAYSISGQKHDTKSDPIIDGVRTPVAYSSIGAEPSKIHLA